METKVIKSESTNNHKKSYNTPKLYKYGKVASLTAQSSKGKPGSDSGGGSKIYK